MSVGSLSEKPWASGAKVFGPPCLVQGRNDGWPVLGRRKGLFEARLRGWRKEGLAVFVHGQWRRRGAVHVAGRRGARIGRGERIGERIGREARPLRAVVVVRVEIQLVTRSLVERAINVHHVGGFAVLRSVSGGMMRQELKRAAVGSVVAVRRRDGVGAGRSLASAFRFPSCLDLPRLSPLLGQCRPER